MFTHSKASQGGQSSYRAQKSSYCSRGFCPSISTKVLMMLRRVIFLDSWKMIQLIMIREKEQGAADGAGEQGRERGCDR
ncbi:hypothetical protein E2C01_007786 [Portunus trituberculatus]|uniref:Uncharacterized protein n=1 Tax=Portunus trituberculatus TaxID=210409 RepID=A0A5B7D242_PORTR|nr:hypothetical protein [Portunus trituberculatus]